MSECSNEIKNAGGVNWFKRPGMSGCYPAVGADNGYANVSACLASPPSCSSDDCPDEARTIDVNRMVKNNPVVVSLPTNGCVATSAPSVENYTPCCRPQVYVNLNQTWKKQGMFDL